MIIRKIESEQDYNKVLEIRKKVFIDEQKVPESIEIDNYEKSAIYFIAEIDGKALGTGRFRIKEGYIKFERIATLKETRGKGVGKALMEYMKNYALEYYPEYLPAMHAQDSAIGFYENIGWLGIGEKFLEADIWHQTMVYPIGKEQIPNLKIVKNKMNVVDKVRDYLLLEIIH